MCHRIGLPPTSIIGLGRTLVSSEIRVPRPPARITAFNFFQQQDQHVACYSPAALSCPPAMGPLPLPGRALPLARIAARSGKGSLKSRSDCARLANWRQLRSRTNLSRQGELALRKGVLGVCAVLRRILALPRPRCITSGGVESWT